MISGDGVVVIRERCRRNLFGIAKESVVGSSVYDMDSIHPDDQEQLRAAFAAAARWRGHDRSGAGSVSGIPTGTPSRSRPGARSFSTTTSR